MSATLTPTERDLARAALRRFAAGQLSPDEIER